MFLFPPSPLFLPVGHCFSRWLKINFKVYDIINCLNKNLWYIMLPSKWENSSCSSANLIYICKKLPLALDWQQSNYILCKYLILIFLQFFGWLLQQLLFCVISRSASYLWWRNFEITFAALYFYLYELKKRVSDF